MTIFTPEELIEKYRLLLDDQREAVSALVEKHFAAQQARGTKTHRAYGRLIFEPGLIASVDKPLHHIQVELWNHKALHLDWMLGAAETDAEGYFEIWYDHHHAAMLGSVDLELHVFDTHHTYDRHQQVRSTKKLICKIEGGYGVTERNYDFGTQSIPYWEYDFAAISPRLLIVEYNTAPQHYATGRLFAMTKAIAPLELKKRMHLMHLKHDPERPTLLEIQESYPENMTRRLEREQPGITRSDAFFGDRLMNGMSASIFDKDRNHPGWYRLYHHWNAYEQDGVHCLPNVDMRFEMQMDGLLYPVQITLQMRPPNTPEAHAECEPPITLYPEDGEKWLAAKRAARVSAALSVELDFHLTTTHLNTEQYALAAYRNLRLNPLRDLLFPHLKEVVLVNHSAEELLLNENGYITRASALTEVSIYRRIREVMGTLDWKNWQPRRIISSRHTFGRAADLYWEMLTEVVDRFFEQHKAEIKLYWYEVRRMSDELILNSVPFVPASIGSIDWYWYERTESSAAAELPIDDWWDSNERMDLNIPRVEINGKKKALQPITLRDTPTGEDIENMKQVCRYVIMHATFLHSWSNSRQYDDGGEVLYNCLGLRYGKNGILVPESDWSIAPTPEHATEMLWISCFLSKTGYGYIMKNEDHDIYPPLIEALGSYRDAFHELGVDIYSIQSRTNI